jgi:hypothetical protein
MNMQTTGSTQRSNESTVEKLHRSIAIDTVVKKLCFAILVSVGDSVDNPKPTSWRR